MQRNAPPSGWPSASHFQVPPPSQCDAEETERVQLNDGTPKMQSDEIEEWNLTASECSGCHKIVPHSQLFSCTRKGCPYAYQLYVSIRSPSQFYNKVKVFCGSCSFYCYHHAHKRYMKPVEKQAIEVASNHVSEEVEAEYAKAVFIDLSHPVDWVMKNDFGAELKVLPLLEYLRTSSDAAEWMRKKKKVDKVIESFREAREVGMTVLREVATNALAVYTELLADVESDEIRSKQKKETEEYRQNDHKTKMMTEKERREAEEQKRNPNVLSPPLVVPPPSESETASTSEISEVVQTNPAVLSPPPVVSPPPESETQSPSENSEVVQTEDPKNEHVEPQLPSDVHSETPDVSPTPPIAKVSPQLMEPEIPVDESEVPDGSVNHQVQQLQEKPTISSSQNTSPEVSRPSPLENKDLEKKVFSNDDLYQPPSAVPYGEPPKPVQLELTTKTAENSSPQSPQMCPESPNTSTETIIFVPDAYSKEVMVIPKNSDDSIVKMLFTTISQRFEEIREEAKLEEALTDVAQLLDQMTATEEQKLAAAAMFKEKTNFAIYYPIT